jgi:hypothetical protein
LVELDEHDHEQILRSGNMKTAQAPTVMIEATEG